MYQFFVEPEQIDVASLHWKRTVSVWSFVLSRKTE